MRELELWHPFYQPARDPAPVRIVGGEGAYLYTDDGRRLVDGISSWWRNLHGHNHPRIMSALAEQTKRLDPVLLAGFTHETRGSWGRLRRSRLWQRTRDIRLPSRAPEATFTYEL